MSSTNSSDAADLQGLAEQTGFNPATYKTFQSERTRPQANPASHTDAHPRPVASAAPPPLSAVAEPRSADAPPIAPATALTHAAAPDPAGPAQKAKELLESAESFARTALPLNNLVQFSRWDRWSGLDVVLDIHTQNNGGQSGARPSTHAFCLTGACSGVGISSLAASLARLAARRSEQVLLLDVSPNSLLPLFFGGRMSRSPISSFAVPGDHRCGTIHACRREETEHPESAESWVARCLNSIARESDQFVVDAGLSQICKLTHERISGVTQLLVLVPDTRSLAGLRRLEAVRVESRHPDACVPLLLLNQYDPADPLHAEIRARLTSMFPDRLLPVVIRRDRHVPAALAEGMTVIDYAPESHASEDLFHLDQWLCARFLQKSNQDLSEKVPAL